jgi:glycosyltransferase involved in cell wall biosynthesis|tara:strand:+ start:1242 stop:2885 length:1644 start_codon:yes stop_codon:yes gene_type:complete
MKTSKRVLFCSEASWLSTGYSVYTREVLSRLSQIDNLEVAELACYAAPDDPNIASTPWKVFANKPLPDSPFFSSYKSSPSAQFGEQTFNSVLLDFRPDIVIDIRDWWMIEYQQRSPFRDFFHWAIMPTVDAEPQDLQWVNTYASADAVFAYSEFGRDTLLSQCDDINFIDIPSPAANEVFMPVVDKDKHKNAMGVSEKSMIIGTVMRNQKRKLYPDLFASFKEFLNKIDNDSVFLYCHTYYPDVGWDIPRLLDEYGLSSRVLFTYKCKQCKHVSVDFFHDTIQPCQQCGGFTNQLAGISNSLDSNELAAVYNVFDIYVQYANSEGFGMPQLEAAYCGLPVISIYYSAMQSVVDNIGAIGINPLTFSLECETGCKRAIPDNEKFIEELIKLYNNRDKLRSIGIETCKRAKTRYTWDGAANIWADHIKNVPTRDPRETWLSPPKIFQPATSIPSHLSTNVDKVNFIFANILHKPEWIGGYLWKRVLKDCTFGYRCENLNKDFYFNESHKQSFSSNVPFSFEDACKEMANFRGQINKWETARANSAKERA